MEDVEEYYLVSLKSSREKKAIVWDADSFQPIATLKHNQEVQCSTISDEFVITASNDNRLSVFENAPNFTLQNVLRIPKGQPIFRFFTMTFSPFHASEGS